MIREVENAFVDFPGNRCFACHPDNEHGLRLKFFADDEKGEVFTKITPEHKFAGFPNILHGGIQSALLDEVAFWTMFDKLKKIGLTTKIELQYNKAVKMDQPLEIRGKVVNQRGRYVFVDALLRYENGDDLTSGRVAYFLPKKVVLFDIFGEESFTDKFLQFIEE